MTIPAENGEPTRLTAGDAWRWRVTLAQFPAADGWTLAYALRGPAKIDVAVAIVAGTSATYDAAKAAADTGGVAPGLYQLYLVATNGADRRSQLRGRVDVRPDPLAAGNDAAFTSHNRRTLDAITARIEGRADDEVESYQVEGRALNLIPMRELVALRVRYQWAVYFEENPRRPFPSVGVSFK